MKNRQPLQSGEIGFAPMPDGRNWQTLTPIEFAGISVPVGTRTDFASVPRAFWSIFPPFGPYMKAAVLHDYLYQSHLLPRKDADKLFLQAMTELQVPRSTRTIMYWAVRLFGAKAYNSYDGLDRGLIDEPETLSAKQQRFVWMVGKLIQFAYAQGYGLTLGHALRCEECLIGQANSLHKIKLAIDLNLFRNGEYLSRTQDHQVLGEYWESLGGTWGGWFGDGNHYSLEHNGRK